MRGPPRISRCSAAILGKTAAGKLAARTVSPGRMRHGRPAERVSRLSTRDKLDAVVKFEKAWNCKLSNKVVNYSDGNAVRRR